MQIIYSIPDIDLNANNGGSAHANGTLKSMIKLGHKVYVICNNKGEINTKYFILKKSKSGKLRNIKWFFYPFIISIYLILTKKIGLVYERARIFGGGAILASKFFNKKSIYEMNEPLGKGKTISKKIIFNWNKKIANSAKLVIGTHKEIFKGIVLEKRRLVCWGVDTEIFFPTNKPKEIIKKLKLKNKIILLYSGSFSEWHSCEEIISTLSRLDKELKNIILIMVGEGKTLMKCKDLASKLGLEKKVIFLGKVKHQNMPLYINAADICFALFNRDYFQNNDYYFSPIKIHEYKACGKPIIASNIGNITTLVKDNINGFAVNEKNIKEISEKVKKLIKDKGILEKISKNNVKEAKKKYDWLKITKKILSFTGENK